MKAEKLLSDEFAEFSKKIADLKESHKEKKQQLKALFAEVQKIETEASNLQKEFEAWAADQKPQQN